MDPSIAPEADAIPRASLGDRGVIVRKGMAMSYTLELSELLAFKMQNEVDNRKVMVTFTLHPTPDDTVQVTSSVHKRVLDKVPVFRDSIKAEEDSTRTLHLTATATGKASGLEKLLEYLYTHHINPDDLVNVFGFALQLKVELNLYSLGLALNCENGLELLASFPMTDTPEEKVHRKLILDTVTADPVTMLSSPAFLKIKGEMLLQELVNGVVGRVESALLYKPLEKWAEAECIRNNLEVSYRNKLNMIPDGIKEIDVGLALSFYYLRGRDEGDDTSTSSENDEEGKEETEDSGLTRSKSLFCEEDDSSDSDYSWHSSNEDDSSSSDEEEGSWSAEEEAASRDGTEKGGPEGAAALQGSSSGGTAE